jgi:hypothetical protein
MYMIKCKCVKAPLYFENIIEGQIYSGSVWKNRDGENVISVCIPNESQDLNCAWESFKEYFELVV